MVGHAEVEPERVLLVDGCAGIYVPQRFAQNYDMRFWGVSVEAEAVLLSGPDHEDYWEVWDEVLMECGVGGDWRLWQDGDLWAEGVV